MERTSWKLLKPWYEVGDSGDSWYVTIRKHMKKNQGLTYIPTDEAVFVRKTTDCYGVLGLLVKDKVGYGVDGFVEVEQLTGNTLSTKNIVLPTLEFAGETEEQANYGYKANQAAYAK